jgi:hypothetical protein
MRLICHAGDGAARAGDVNWLSPDPGPLSLRAP